MASNIDEQAAMRYELDVTEKADRPTGRMLIGAG